MLGIGPKDIPPSHVAEAGAFAILAVLADAEGCRQRAEELVKLRDEAQAAQEAQASQAADLSQREAAVVAAEARCAEREEALTNLTVQAADVAQREEALRPREAAIADNEAAAESARQAAEQLKADYEDKLLKLKAAIG